MVSRYDRLRNMRDAEDRVYSARKYKERGTSLRRAGLVLLVADAALLAAGFGGAFEFNQQSNLGLVLLGLSGAAAVWLGGEYRLFNSAREDRALGDVRHWFHESTSD